MRHETNAMKENTKAIGNMTLSILLKPQDDLCLHSVHEELPPLIRQEKSGSMPGTHRHNTFAFDQFLHASHLKENLCWYLGRETLKLYGIYCISSLWIKISK